MEAFLWNWIDITCKRSIENFRDFWQVKNGTKKIDTFCNFFSLYINCIYFFSVQTLNILNHCTFSRIQVWQRRTFLPMWCPKGNIKIYHLRTSRGWCSPLHTGTRSTNHFTFSLHFTRHMFRAHSFFFFFVNATKHCLLDEKKPVLTEKRNKLLLTLWKHRWTNFILRSSGFLSLPGFDLFFFLSLSSLIWAQSKTLKNFNYIHGFYLLHNHLNVMPHKRNLQK